MHVDVETARAEHESNATAAAEKVVVTTAAAPQQLLPLPLLHSPPFLLSRLAYTLSMPHLSSVLGKVFGV